MPGYTSQRSTKNEWILNAAKRCSFKPSIEKPLTLLKNIQKLPKTGPISLKTGIDKSPKVFIISTAPKPSK